MLPLIIAGVVLLAFFASSGPRRSTNLDCYDHAALSAVLQLEDRLAMVGPQVLLGSGEIDHPSLAPFKTCLRDGRDLRACLPETKRALQTMPQGLVVELLNVMRKEGIRKETRNHAEVALECLLGKKAMVPS